MSDLYVGLMSGTSMDGIDVAIVDFTNLVPRVIDFQTFAYPDKLAHILHSLCEPNENEVVSLGHADRATAHAFAQATSLLLDRNNLLPSHIKAIGSHGQTVRHHPEGYCGFSMQIGDPNTLAVETEIDVITDFRRKDIALGGQGAPLAPAFHKAVFTDHNHNRVILNIGGIANLTYLPSSTTENVVGFDTGPGNTLLDSWCKLHTGKSYDKDGAWAAQGKHDPELLEILMSHPFIHQQAPKSSGRETFNLSWLQTQLEKLSAPPSVQSVQATLVLFTCRSIAININQLKSVQQVFVCGGGARNDFLMECLENELFDCELHTTDELGIGADAVEAVAFAWLAYAHLNNIEGNIPAVTGAQRPAVLGGMYRAN